MTGKLDTSLPQHASDIAGVVSGGSAEVKNLNVVITFLLKICNTPVIAPKQLSHKRNIERLK
jgi:hypothetical protein